MAEQETAKNEGGNKTLPKGAERPPGDIRRRVPKKQRTGPFVKYVGPAAQRIINPTHWKSLNLDEIKDPKAVHVWNVANDKMIEASRFSDEQLDYLLIDDLQPGSNAHSFLAVNFDKDGNLRQVEI